MCFFIVQGQKQHTSVSGIVSSRNIFFLFPTHRKTLRTLLALFVQQLGKFKRLATVFRKQGQYFSVFRSAQGIFSCGRRGGLMVSRLRTAGSLWKYIATFCELSCAQNVGNEPFARTGRGP